MWIIGRQLSKIDVIFNLWCLFLPHRRILIFWADGGAAQSNFSGLAGDLNEENPCWSLFGHYSRLFKICTLSVSFNSNRWGLDSLTNRVDSTMQNSACKATYLSIKTFVWIRANVHDWNCFADGSFYRNEAHERDWHTCNCFIESVCASISIILGAISI